MKAERLESASSGLDAPPGWVPFEVPRNCKPQIWGRGEKKVLHIPAEFFTHTVCRLSIEANRFLPPEVLESWKMMLNDPETKPLERWVLASLLTNAAISAANIGWSFCQDTGQVIVIVDRGEKMVVSDMEEAINAGVAQAYTDPEACMRPSMTERQLGEGERGNTGDNTPAEIIHRILGGERERELDLILIPKGGGSTAATRLFMGTAATDVFQVVGDIVENEIGTAACPPGRLGVGAGFGVITAMLQSLLAAYDFRRELPVTEAAEKLAKDLKARLRKSNLGAQFGGPNLVADVVAVEGPSHIATKPIALTWLCSAARMAEVRVISGGLIYRRPLATNPRDYFPDNMKTMGVEVKHRLRLPITDAGQLAEFHAGDVVSLSGIVYVARDVAHKRTIEAWEKTGKLPFDPSGAAFYYSGPAEPPKGCVIGSCGPTTSRRMDPFTPKMMELGAKVFIGKGPRSTIVRAACQDHGAVCLSAIGGPAALIAQKVKKAEIIDYKDLGPEALREIVVKDFQAVVVNDVHGKDLEEELKKGFIPGI